MSYGTFTPYPTHYAIDSEYLKSLISSKAYNEDESCELTDSASFSPRRDAFPATLTGETTTASSPINASPSRSQSQPRKEGPFSRQDSGLGRSYNNGLAATNGVAVNASACDIVRENGTAINVRHIDKLPKDRTKGNFFAECEEQVSKLFSFMDIQLSHVERQLETAMTHAHHARRTRRYLGGAPAESTAERCPLSVGIINANIKEASRLAVEKDLDGKGGATSDSGLEESQDLEELGLFSMDHEQKAIENSIGVLSRIKDVIVGLQESFNNSIASLDHLLGMHDDRMVSQDGQVYLDSVETKRTHYHQRISQCLEEVDAGLNELYHEKEIRIDGLGRVRSHIESKINAQVRKSPVRCVTLFLALLFAIILGVITFMDVWDNTAQWTVYLRLVRGPLLVLLCIYLFGINMKIWAVSKIDYVSIFEYHVRGTPTPRYVFKVASILTVFFAGLIVILLIASPFSSRFPGRIVSILMWLTLLAFLFNPFDVLLRRARFSFILVCVRILIAPFHFVYFGDFFLADQLNSTVAIMLDVQYLICYSVSQPWGAEPNEKICTSSGNGIRPVISCLPALWRLLQCLRCFYDTKKVKHLINAGKYFTTFPVVVLATLFSVKVKVNSFNFSFFNLDLNTVGWIIILWVIFAIIHSVYTFIWDVYCDWGLWNCSEKTCLRPYLVYKYRILYYLTILLDLVLRFAWTAKLTLAIVWHMDSDLIYTCLVIAEILRRFIWNFFRVEFAHVLAAEQD